MTTLNDEKIGGQLLTFLDDTRTMGNNILVSFMKILILKTDVDVPLDPQ